ncbi:hypothetical protein [Dyella sp. ASV21]|uniref:hypothetical protein n=1 Tax=Dyella sp. ASV21 TaxID=2795114 RepID=UPI0018EE3D71|nr:hypothetical protein [Dyella sp. ASV21]
MAFFKLSAPVRLYQYPFDYHSHLGGILPVRGHDGLSLVGWLHRKKPADVEDGEFRLFDQALQFMQQSNPFALLAAKKDVAAYERAECAAENIYIAGVLITQHFRPGEGVDELPVTDARLYAVCQQLIKDARAKGGEAWQWTLGLMRYFNDKIYSSNKYTPFDDAYKTRSSMVDRIHAVPKDGEEDYVAWIDATLEFLYQQGIRHIQIPAGRDDIPTLDARMGVFNARPVVQYRALVHTPAAYVSEKAFSDDLAKIKSLLTHDSLSWTIGLDVLGVENRVADYGTLFKFLQENRQDFSDLLAKKKSNSLIVHIHNGEGASASEDHRSLIGYYMAYGERSPESGFYGALSSYIAQCARTASERRGTSAARAGSMLGHLFDELFSNNSLTYRGCRLRRFDINSEHSRALAAYNGKRSVMALAETLDSPAVAAGNKTYYAVLTGDESPYAFRLGHAYYYRNYTAAKFPAVAFDTNLGSNAITGAGGLFATGESYRINKGFRHLEGYIDTDVLAAASTAVAYMSSDSLTEDQIGLFVATSQKQGDMQSVLADTDVQKDIRKQLKVVLGDSLKVKIHLDLYYTFFANLVTNIVGDSVQQATRYQALTRVFALFCNWRSYLLGADGQGVEHSDIQDEFLRMVILLTYNLLPTGKEHLLEDTMDQLQKLLLLIAAVYWQSTVAQTAGVTTPMKRSIESLEGFKSPGSVLTIRRGKAQGS